MTRLTVLAFALVAACSSPPDLAPVPGQGLFTAIVWNDTFGQADKAPAIEWRRDLTCTSATGFPGFENSDGTCVNGNWAGDPWVSVADLPDFHDRGQMVVHEYLHVLLARVGRDDPDHRQPEWQQGGLFDRAMAALAAAGW